MSKLILQQAEMTARDGTPVRFVYDEEADILELFFGENAPATGIELSDHIILRLERQTKRALSLMLLHFSILSEQTEYGPRSFPLENLERLPRDLRELVLRLLTSLPVSQFLRVSQLQMTPPKFTPIATVESHPILAYAWCCVKHKMMGMRCRTRRCLVRSIRRIAPQHTIKTRLTGHGSCCCSVYDNLLHQEGRDAGST